MLVVGLLLRRRIALLLAAHGEQVDVDAGEALREAQRQHRSDERAPVAALHAEAVVAEHRHQLGVERDDLLDGEALLPRTERERVARQRRRDHGEVLGEQRDDLVKLEHRARPAVRDEQRRRAGLARGLVDEVQVDAADRQRELAEAVELGFPRPPVEAGAPVFDEVPHVRETRAGGPRRSGGSSGQRVRARRSRRSVMALSGMCSVKGFMLPRPECEPLHTARRATGLCWIRWSDAGFIT